MVNDPDPAAETFQNMWSLWHFGMLTLRTSKYFSVCILWCISEQTSAAEENCKQKPCSIAVRALQGKASLWGEVAWRSSVSFLHHKVSKRAGSLHTDSPLSTGMEWGSDLGYFLTTWDYFVETPISYSHLMSGLSPFLSQLRCKPQKKRQNAHLFGKHHRHPQSFISTLMLMLCIPFSSLNIPLSACKLGEQRVSCAWGHGCPKQFLWTRAGPRGRCD